VESALPRNVKSSTGFVAEREVFKLSRGLRDSTLEFHCCCYNAEIELPINFKVIMILLPFDCLYRRFRVQQGTDHNKSDHTYQLCNNETIHYDRHNG
jgi:hypothetical protein